MDHDLHHDLGVPSNVTLAQLRAFLAVARCEHVTRAAAELGLTQPAVSHQLRSLESALGIALTERDGRRIRVTPEGRALVPAIAAALESVRSLAELVDARRSLRQGVLDLAASNTVGIYCLPRWLTGFVDRHPGLEVRAHMVNTGTAIELLLAAEVDCALIEGPCDQHDLEVTTVARDELVLVVSSRHALARRKNLALDELAEHRYLAREDGSGTEALASQLLGAAYRTGPVLELDQVDAVRAAMLAGLGYAVLPRLALDDDLRSGVIRVLPLPRSTLLRELRAVRRPGSHRPALTAFWEHLQSVRAASSEA